jgi:hypothetical protein
VGAGASGGMAGVRVQRLMRRSSVDPPGIPLRPFLLQTELRAGVSHTGVSV